MSDLEPLRQDALAKVRRKYLQELLTDAALVALSDFLDTLFRYPAGSRGWQFEAMVLARTPLYYLDVSANDLKSQPRVTRLLVGEALYRGRTTQLYALPDWSPLLRQEAQPRPRGASAGFFGGQGSTRPEQPAQLPLKGAAA